MKKSLILALSVIVLTSLMLMPNRAFAANPPSNPYEILLDTTTGGGAVTLDPANCYDTASAEILFNTYETLIFFDGERYDVFKPALATQVWIGPPQTNPGYGPTSPDYTYFTVYFKIRVGVPFHNWSRTDEPMTWGNYYLTTDDVEYSFERWMVHSYVGGPQWLIYEPLLDCFDAEPLTSGFGQAIDDSVQKNSTYVWMNIANKERATITSPVTNYTKMFATEDGTFSPTFWDDVAHLTLNYPLRVFNQVISQSWASILSKQWIIDYVIPRQDDWNGNFATWTSYTQWSGTQAPLDKIPGGAAHPGVTLGTGPFILDRYDPSDNGYWSMVKFDDYWGGWPAKNPNPPYSPLTPSDPNQKPAGYVTRITDRQRSSTLNWQELKNGQADLAVVSRTACVNLHVGGRNAETVAGIRLNYPVPALTINTFHFTFDIEATGNLYGDIYATDVLGRGGIPRNFFSDVNVRRAFASLINFTLVIQDQLLGEAYQPHTLAPDGLPYVNLTQTTYGPGPNFAAAAAFFAAAWAGKLGNAGFTVHLTYNSGNTVRQAITENLAAMVNYVGNTFFGGNFTAIAQGVSWDLYIPAMDAHELPSFCIGWLADYVDLQNFMFPYLHSQGTFALSQHYNNPTADALLDNAIRTPDGPARQAVYYELESLAYFDVPSVAFLVAIGRGYMRSYIQGQYYNPLYPGFYGYNKWKWEYKRGNVNFDNKVDLQDITDILDYFGSYAGKLGMPVFHPRWNFFDDVDGNPKDSSPAGDGGWRDRKVDLYDISTCLDNFGKADQTWISPVPEPHDLYLTLNGVSYMYWPDTPTATFTYRVKNTGLNAESSTVYLYVDGVAVQTNAFGPLAPGAQTGAYTYVFSPADPGIDSSATYNITAYVVPVLGETHTSDNIQTYIVLVEGQYS